jgi:Delta3-Delta2-enoyl-CoA isomerase
MKEVHAMGLVDYTIQGHVALVTLNDRDNRFNPPFLDKLLEALDQIETRTQARTLLIQSTHEKIFSNGIDLDWLQPILQQNNLSVARQFFHQLNRLFKRLLTYPLVTVGAITGHAFGGGAILACAFDFRFMRSDRGFFCLPEVDVGVPFLPGMIALLRSAIPAHVLRELQLTGVRLTGEECERHHIVQRACPLDELLTVSMAFARQVNKQRAIVAEIKTRNNREIIQIMDETDIPYIEGGRYIVA